MLDEATNPEMIASNKSHLSKQRVYDRPGESKWLDENACKPTGKLHGMCTLCALICFLPPGH